MLADLMRSLAPPVRRPSALAARAVMTATAGGSRPHLADGRADAARPVGRARRGPHGAARRRATGAIGGRSRCDCPDGRFPSVGRTASAGDPAGARDPRSVRAGAGRAARHAALARSWPWACAIRSATEPTPPDGAPYAFLPAEGEGLHQIPVGPVHAGIIEPGPFPLHRQRRDRRAAGGAAGLCPQGHRGADGRRAARRGGAARRPHLRRQHGRLSASPSPAPPRRRSASQPPPRAVWLRALMAELERLANHLGDIGAICNDAVLRACMHAHCGVLRERVLRAADGCFGHRLMMDRIVPGGVAVDLGRDGGADRSALVGEAAAARSRRWSSSTTTRRRCRTAPSAPASLQPELARQFGAGGYVGRASGRAFDARRTPGYPPYDALDVRGAGARARATSTPASGSASTRSSRAWR